MDFVCMESKLMVEVDGSQCAGRKVEDAACTEYLARGAFRVLGVGNDEALLRLDAVLTELLNTWAQTPPHPIPLQRSGEAA